MSKIQGIGGVFIYSVNPVVTAEWYNKHLGIKFHGFGDVQFTKFPSQDVDQYTPPRNASTAFSIMKWDSKNGEFPKSKSIRINFRVHDLHDLLKTLKENNVEVEDKTQEDAYGKFGWCQDIDGNRLEFWEAPVKPA